MRAEVTFLSRMVVGIDEDRVVRAGRHARLATDADRLIEINYAVRAFEHSRGWAGGDARRVSALIATSHLVRAARLREYGLSALL